MSLIIRKPLLYRGKIYRAGDYLEQASPELLANWVENGVVVEKEEETAISDSPFPNLTTKELREELDKHNIPFKPGMRKEEMIALLQKAKIWA